MTAAVIAFSQKGYALGERLITYFKQSGDTARLTRCEPGRLPRWTRACFGRDALIFIGSCGIAVRAVAPFLKSKATDPAVIVIDELAAYTVPLLSGHIGGANDLAVRLARFLGAVPVVTTATDINGVLAVDAWAVKHGLKIANPGQIKRVSARPLAGEAICLQSDFPVLGRPPRGVTLCEKDGDVLITHRARGGENALRLIPPAVTLGVGCKRGVEAGALERAFWLILKKAGCHPLAVARVCSIELKAREPGLLEFCRGHTLPCETFSARELAALPGEYAASAFVKRVTGVDNVCERSAVLGSGEGGRLLEGKTAGNGVAMALALSPFAIYFDEEAEL